MTLKKQLTGLFATAVLMAQVMYPAVALADNTFVISGNGADSTNKTYFTTTNTNTVVQNNKAIVSNMVNSNTSTGGNVAEENTGGDVTIHTGDATSKTVVENTLNSNKASVDCCNQGDTYVKIAGNGAESYNKASIKESAVNSIFQDNFAKVKNSVDADAKTGGNIAEDNTGGDVTIHSGDAKVGVMVSTKANQNTAKVGGSDQEPGSLAVEILGNGSDSYNKVRLGLDRVNTIVQDNFAMVKNRVEADAKTGGNMAEENTGGELVIATGDAKSLVGIDNQVNFNSADVDCGCLQDIFGKIAENGAESNNKIKAQLGNVLDVFQGGEDGNKALLFNMADSNAKTGWNLGEDNTGTPEGGDPWILTGDSLSEVSIENTGNSNVFGSALPSNWPNFGLNLSITLDLDDLLALLQG